jgi:hypothetical protein
LKAISACPELFDGPPRRSLVQASDLPDGTVVAANTVVVGGIVVGTVEW